MWGGVKQLGDGGVYTGGPTLDSGDGGVHTGGPTLDSGRRTGTSRLSRPREQRPLPSHAGSTPSRFPSGLVRSGTGELGGHRERSVRGLVTTLNPAAVSGGHRGDPHPLALNYSPMHLLRPTLHRWASPIFFFF